MTWKETRRRRDTSPGTSFVSADVRTDKSLSFLWHFHQRLQEIVLSAGMTTASPYRPGVWVVSLDLWATSHPQADSGLKPPGAKQLIFLPLMLKISADSLAQQTHAADKPESRVWIVRSCYSIYPAENIFFPPNLHIKAVASSLSFFLGILLTLWWWHWCSKVPGES